MIANSKYFNQFSIILVIALSACGTNKEVVNSIPSPQLEGISNVLWQQTSAEYEALCYQAFNTASARLTDEAINSLNLSKPAAIIMDLDETVLDNSPYNGYLTLNNQKYSKESWMRWTSLEKAELVPGAEEFIHSLADYGLVTLFFISNRREEELESTIANLQKQGIEVNRENIFLKGEDVRSKTDRRQRVESSYEVIMLFGDNLADFDDVFEESLNLSARKEATFKLRNEFGRKFIVLPNVMYGGWEESLKMEDPKSIQNPNQEGKLRYIKTFSPK